MQAMLLAAGLGTRLRPFTFVRPKPLFPILNQPLLTILLDMLHGAGAKEIVVNGHHLGDQVRKAVSGRKGLFYQYEPEILGTGGSLRRALPRLSEAPLLVMNGDIFHNIDLLLLYDHHIRSGNRITMAMHDYPRFNTVEVRDGFIRTFHPELAKEVELLAFTGIHIVEPSVIEMIPFGKYFHIIDLYEQLASKGENIGILRVDGSLWEDIGTPEDYLGLHGRLLSGEIQPPSPVPAPTKKWLISKESNIQDDVQFDGWGCIGNAKVGSGVHMQNCVVWDGAVIGDGAWLANKIVIPQL